MNVTNLDPALFSVMNQESVSVRTTPLVTSVTCVSGGTLDFLTLPVKRATAMPLARTIPRNVNALQASVNVSPA